MSVCEMSVCEMTKTFKISWYINGRFEAIRTNLIYGTVRRICLGLL